jgi:hypothetical protein
MVSATTRFAAALALTVLVGYAQHAAPAADQTAAAPERPKPTVEHRPYPADRRAGFGFRQPGIQGDAA